MRLLRSTARKSLQPPWTVREDCEEEDGPDDAVRQHGQRRNVHEGFEVDGYQSPPAVREESVQEAKAEVFGRMFMGARVHEGRDGSRAVWEGKCTRGNRVARVCNPFISMKRTG